MAISCLAGCATLPAPEATAFRKIAAASDTAFTRITEAEREVLTGVAVRQTAAERGTIDPQDCAVRGRKPCRLRYVFEAGDSISLSQSAPNMRALVGAISHYGEQMAELAEAKDIAEAADKAQAAGGAVKTLFSVALPAAAPIVGPIVDAATLALREGLVAKRRHLMLVNAEKADEAIQAASKQMSDIARPVRTNVEAAAVIDLNDAKLALDESAATAKRLSARANALRDAAERGRRGAEEQLDRAEARLAAVRATRAAHAQTIIRSGNAVNAARRIKVDFSALATGHAALLKKLRNPAASLEDAVAQLDEFLVVLDAFASAAGA